MKKEINKQSDKQTKGNLDKHFAYKLQEVSKENRPQYQSNQKKTVNPQYYICPMLLNPNHIFHLYLLKQSFLALWSGNLVLPSGATKKEFVKHLLNIMGSSIQYFKAAIAKHISIPTLNQFSLRNCLTLRTLPQTYNLSIKLST